MASRKEQKILNNVSISGNTETDQISILDFVGLSIQVVTTGTAVGTIKLYSSNDEEGISSANSSWDKIEGGEFISPVAGSMTFNIKEIYSGKIKMQYVAGSGTGTMTARLVGKGYI